MANRYMVDGKLVSADIYNKVKYDSMLVRFPKGQKDIIQSHAVARGESVNGFIGRAIGETMERDNGGGTDSRANAAQDAAESVSSVMVTLIPPEPNTPTDHAPTLTEAKRIVRAAGDVILPSMLRESVAEASKAAGETDDAFLWRAVSTQAEQDKAKQEAAVNASDAPQGVLVPLVVSLSLDELERAKTAATVAGEGVTAFLKRAVMEATKRKAVRKPTKRTDGEGKKRSGGEHGT